MLPAASGGSKRASTTSEGAASGDDDGDDDAYTIRVQTRVYASAAQVWRVLTDQARWAEVVPSVVRAPAAAAARAAPATRRESVHRAPAR